MKEGVGPSGSVIIKQYLDGTTWKLESPDQQVVNISVQAWRNIAAQLGWDEEIE